MADFSVVPPGSFPSDPTASDGTTDGGSSVDFLSGLGDFLDSASTAFSNSLKAFNAPGAVTVGAVKNAPPAAGVNGGAAASAPSSASSTNMLLLGGALVIGAVLLAKLV